MRRFRRLHDQHGSIALAWVMSLMGFLAFLTIVADGGLIAAERRSLQNAADAAALAGAQALPLAPATARADAHAWTEKNYPDLVNSDAAVSADQTEIAVTVRHNAGGLFQGNLSLGRPEVEADATARVATKALPGPGVAPIGIPQETYFTPSVQAGEPVRLRFGPPGQASDCGAVTCTSGGTTTSNAGLLSIDGIGANQVRNAFIYGSAGALTPSEESQPGQDIGPVLQGLQTRLEAAIANSCFTWEEVTASVQGAAWRCGPYQAAAAHLDGIQATSVIGIPVTVQTFTEEHGRESVDIYQTDSGLYLLAYFWVDALATFTDPLNGDWNCVSGLPSGCDLVGRLLFEMPSALGVAQPGDALINYDPAGMVRVIQLVD